MSRDIIDYGPLKVNTYAGGKERGECVQFTPCGSGGTGGTGESAGYACMTREEAINFLSEALWLLIEQKDDDKINPPWWQKVTE